MKSKFLRIIALILVMSSLISMFAIFASADETGTNGETGEEEEDNLVLLYNRTYDEGWDMKNGAQIQDQGSTGSTTFEIDYEETFDYQVNYFWRLELNSVDNDFLQIDCGGNDKIGTVFEFDIKSDDIANFSNVVHFGTRGGSSAERSNYNLMRIVNNKVHLMFDEAGAQNPAFELTNSWTRIQMVFDYTYEHETIDRENDDEATILAKEQENLKWFRLYVYYGPADGSEEPTLFNGEPFVLYAKNGRGLQLFRFQSTGSDKVEHYGTSICFDNMKLYDGVNQITPITPEMGFGTLVSPDYPVTEEIIGGSGSVGTTEDLYAALSMKVGVDYCYFNKQKTPIAVAEDGTVFGAPVRVDGEVMLSLDKILEYIGYPYFVHPDGMYIDVTTGTSATYLVVGKDQATVGNSVVQLNKAPGYITDENGNSYLAVALSDVATLFPGYYGDYDDMGFMSISKRKNILDRESNMIGMVAIMKEFVFDYYTGDSIYNDVQAHTNGFQHPYILANGEQLEMLYNEYQDLNTRMENGEIEEGSADYWMWVHYQRIVDNGEGRYQYYAKPDANGTYKTFAGLAPDEYNADGTNKRGTRSLDQNYLDTAGYDIGGRSDIPNRTTYLEEMAYAYVLTKDVKYLKLCYEIAIKLGEWTHWGPGHFLNCADSSNDFALYFDWTYNGYVELANSGEVRPDGSPYDVRELAEILARQGVHEGYLSTNGIVEHLSPPVGAGGASYSARTNNWAAVCVGGMTIASLAILGDVDQSYVDEAKFILSANFKSLVDMGLDIYAPDGAYIEGPGYWNYGTNNLFRMCAALESATGSTYGLMDCWGIDTTCYYACHTEDNDSRYFPFHDGSVGSQDTSYFFYVAKYFDDATLYDVRLNQINGNVKWATILDLIYYPRDIEIKADEVQLDYYSDNIDLFATRSSWERGALFASIIGGENKVSHGQIDAGAFVYHNGGNIWFYDLGTENYNCEGFWPDATRYRYYVMKPEGNNTVAITTDPAGVPYGQVLLAGANAIDWGSNEHGSYVVYDMGETLGKQVGSWQRGMLLTNDRKTTVIQDQIAFKSMQTAYWFAHYSLRYVDKVEITNDGKTAYMRESLGKNEHGEELYQTLRVTLLSPNTNLRFEIMDCYTFVHNTGKEATYSPEDVLALGGNLVAEKSRKDYRKLAVCSGEALNFELAVVIELVDDATVGKKTEIDVGYTMDNMSTWEPYADTRGIKIEDTDTILRRGVPNVSVHLVQSMLKVADMDEKGTLYTLRLKEYYRALTDAYYAVRVLNVDMPAGYENYIAQLNGYRAEFGEYRDAVIKLQKGQLEFVYKLMSLK